jgi:hypothetical protein
VADSWLHEAVCRQRPELWTKPGYIIVCVDRGMNCRRRLCHKATCRQRYELWPASFYMNLCVDRPELWPTVGYMKLYVNRDRMLVFTL